MCPAGVDFEAVIPIVNMGESTKKEEAVDTLNSRWKYTWDKPVSIRCLMSRREAGCIIGKNGETISFLRKRSGAKIKVSDRGVKERIVSVSGNMSAVIRVIKLFCREFAWMYADRLAMENISNIPKFIFRILLPTSLCGPLIGQHGESIHKLRQLTGSLLKITRHKLPNSTDRILFIYGTVAAITMCLEMICALVGEIKGRSNEIPYIPPSKTASAYSGVPSSPQRLKFAAPMISRPCTFRNSGQRVTDLKEADALNELLARCVSLPTAAAAALLPPPPLQLQPPAPQTTYPANATLFSSVLLAASNWEVRRDMLVANDLIGCVIGRGGMKINEIRKASQATIWISNDEKFQYCSRLITIIGSPMAVDSAISMINASLQCREATVLPSEIVQPIS
ncbi:Poly(rC)-binding protein 3 [Echinococcus granulosus]|uniref:PolyrC binding protein 3 n=1 Tax=Echinococcus granulosus TaxID=6210 RepID=A0A068WCU1_ECHGR|nr:Poly(rC)-binding protein 3 [Echinococcus granulosus]CDS15422.1 polyrC binding protein 3 [Echinococcus granulosus]